MSRRRSIQLPNARRSGGLNALDLTLHLTRRLIEVQNDNLQLRRELNRSRLHLHDLERQMSVQVAQVKDLVMSIREFIQLSRVPRSAASDQASSHSSAPTTASTVSLNHSIDHEASHSDLEADQP